MSLFYMNKCVWFLLCLCLMGCQTTPPVVTVEPPVEVILPEQIEEVKPDWGGIYTYYKSMPVEQLEKEISRLAALPDDDEKKLRQVMLYLVPHSPVKNTHQGRTDLRRWIATSAQEQKGLWYLILDILTDTTRLYERLSDQQQKNGVTEGRLLQLEQGMVQLQQQIQQLKSIEQNIIERDRGN